MLLTGDHRGSGFSMTANELLMQSVGDFLAAVVH